MSSYYSDEVACPKCDHTPILCADDYYGRHRYGYICEKCGFETDDYKKLKAIKEKP